MADDLGVNDISANGGRIPTPNIDALAASGVRFTSGYVTAAVCAPSRAALMAGRQQTRFGYEFNPVQRDANGGLAKDQALISQTLKAAGYRTGIVGKWHLGQPDGFNPLDRGFDTFYGVLAGATTYLQQVGPGDLHVKTAEDDRINRKSLPLFDGRTKVDPEGYLTDVFTDKAISFIGKPGSAPFFLYLAYTTPHAPLQASAAYMARVPAGGSDFQRVYHGMMLALDDGVGKLVAHLKATGQFDNTIIFFLSDNGCPSYVGGACSNAPHSGWKGYPWDGGIRVPYLMSWPARIKPAVSTDIVSTLDIAATAAAAAGVSHPGAEGLDLAARLANPDARRDRTLFWRMGVTHVVRKGKWKLIVVNKGATGSAGDELGRSLRPDGQPVTVSPLGQHTVLYDVVSDPGETKDVAAANPKVVQELTAAWSIWNASNVDPQWTSRRGVSADINGLRVELFN
jgi:arylsulfatase A-like enzyme